MKKIFWLLGILAIIFLVWVMVNRSNNEPSDAPDEDISSGTKTSLELKFSTPPFPVPNKFVADLAYGDSPLAVFDIFLPAGPDPAPLVIFIHGGGFTSGDKEAFYKKFPEETKAWLDGGFAVANLNYSFIDENSDGVMATMNDVKRGVQFIRYHAAELGVDKNQVGCMGISAGAGACLWLGTHDDMAVESSNDPIAPESTRLRAVAAINSQSTYDIFKWDDMFDEAYGIRPTEEPKLEPRLLDFYGAKSVAELKDDPKYVTMRKSLDILGMMDMSDAKLWLLSDKPNEQPVNAGILLHHPLHTKALADTAKASGLAVSASAPSIDLLEGKTETVIDFFLRTLK